MADVQPIIRGIQAVGSVMIYYTYNGTDNKLTFNQSVFKIGGDTLKSITASNLKCSGFRLDSTFLEANPQIASSFMIPILGGGAVALTNNNRSGTLTINTTRVSTPDASTGAMTASATSAIGPVDTNEKVYDLTLLLQAQQGQSGGDSAGATIKVVFSFNNVNTVVVFEGCTVASIRPLALSGNDAVDYAASINYLNWKVNYSTDGTAFESSNG